MLELIIIWAALSFVFFVGYLLGHGLGYRKAENEFIGYEYHGPKHEDDEDGGLG